jgi:hypothetical protein
MLVMSGFLPFFLGAGCIESRAQSVTSPLALVEDDSFGVVLPSAPRPTRPYQEPTESAKFHDYLWNAYGPLGWGENLFVAGFHQWKRDPPDWREGMTGYGERFGSAVGITAVQETARYGIAAATHEDTRYFGCTCSGFLPRLGHAALSTLTARRENDGQTVFSYASLLAPYVGSTTAVYAWYPSRYGMKDAFRMGNYSLLGNIGGNISLEFLPHEAHSLQARLHLTNRHAAEQGD